MIETWVSGKCSKSHARERVNTIIASSTLRSSRSIDGAVSADGTDCATFEIRTRLAIGAAAGIAGAAGAAQDRCHPDVMNPTMLWSVFVKYSGHLHHSTAPY